MAYSITRFNPLLAKAKAVFGSDSYYAIAMVRQAGIALDKIHVQKLKDEIEEEQSHATDLCSEQDPFDCDIIDPCGTGDCPFARGEFKNLHTKEFVPYGTKPHGSPACHPKTVLAQFKELRKSTHESTPIPLAAPGEPG